MKKAYLIFSVTFIFVSVSRAATQMSFYGFDADYKRGYTITGSDSGYFNLYLQCVSPNASIWKNSSTVWVMDMGITSQQHHLFHLVGFYGQPFWCSGLPVEVFDSSMAKIGVYNTSLDPFLWADAGGPYRIAAGQSVQLDSSQSYFVWDYGWNPAASLRFPSEISAEWKIDGKSVRSLITFNDLVGTLGLSYGIHSLQLDVHAIYSDVYDCRGSAFSTIEIIPEPMSIFLIGVGTALLRRGRSRRLQ